jgi:hypothetical protein
MSKAPLTVLTRPPLSLLYWTRSKLAHLIGVRRMRRVGGPAMVKLNLELGLRKAHIPFRFDPPISQVTSCVGVLSNPDALRWAIAAKQAGRIERLAAGPNLVVTPLDEDKLLQHPLIDVIITPCKWVSEFYASLAPQIRDKLIEWPVGVDTDLWKPNPDINARPLWLIYDKTDANGQAELVAAKNELARRNLPHKIIKYGTYQPHEYYEDLTHSAAMIYLSPSESQGIAQFEAWSCNVPTLVWDRHRVEWQSLTFTNPLASSSPYLDDSCGIRFLNSEQMAPALDAFLASFDQFRPRDYVLKSFTLMASAAQYAAICRY